MPNSILFGAIGVLAETSELQRQAFNHAFAEAGLTWFWGPDHYADMLQQSGGAARIRAYAEERGDEVDAAALHARKSELFQQKLKGGVDLRPGVRDVIDAATRAGVPLGLCTTTSEANVHQVLSATGLNAEVFSFVGHRGIVENGKPAPDIYLLALKSLGVSAECAVAIEDSAVSAKAARAAGVPTIAFPGLYHGDDAFGDVPTVATRLTIHDVGLSETQTA